MSDMGGAWTLRRFHFLKDHSMSTGLMAVQAPSPIFFILLYVVQCDQISQIECGVHTDSGPDRPDDMVCPAVKTITKYFQ